LIVDAKLFHYLVNSLHFIFSSNYVSSDDDIIRAIEDLESRIPMAITYHWVDGHQDKTKAVGELPWPAQLNVRADELATEAINKRLQQHRFRA
jgi:ribonuclease HI